MFTRYGLTLDEAAWLLKLNAGSAQQYLSRIGLSDAVLDALLDGHLMTLQDGVVEVTAKGRAVATRLSAEMNGMSGSPATPPDAAHFLLLVA